MSSSAINQLVINPKTADRRKLVENLFPYIVLVLIALPLLTFRINVYPSPWFDEGVNMNAALTFAQRGVYGTYTVEGFNVLDPALTTGPPVILPVGVIFKLFGQGVFEARIVTTFYAMLAVVCLFGLVSKMNGRRAAYLITLGFLAVPAIGDTGFILMSRQVMGETPSLALLLLGMWLWIRSYESEQWIWSLFAGLVCGLAIVAKMQTSFVILPALALVGLARGKGQSLKSALRHWTPAVLALAMAIGWLLILQLGPTGPLRVENRQLNWEALQTLLVPGFWQRSLSRGALFILLLMGVALVTTARRLFKSRSAEQQTSNEQWVEVTLGLMVLTSALWFGFLSIGWPRYSYLGLMIAYILLGKFAWGLLQSLKSKLAITSHERERKIDFAVFSSLAFMTLVINVIYIARQPAVDWAQTVADFISSQIPRETVIESWEWEIDALSKHWEFHHPSQNHLMLAVRQRFLGSGEFDLEYDLLEADPDYLIVGTFSEWTGIYDEKVLVTEFNVLVNLGPYEVLERKRN